MKVPWSFRRRWKTWWTQKRFELELWHSRQFQKRCERLQCFKLATLEQNYRERLIAKNKEDRGE